MAVNFVKFERGSSEVYNRLKGANRLDENTLYFIYDKNHPEDGGLLYLGYTLIGGTGSSVGLNALSDLTDVDITNVSDASLLWYNQNTGKWEATSPQQVIESTGISIGGNNVTVVDEVPQGSTPQEVLETIQEPSPGDIAIIAGEPFIYDGEGWQSLASSNLEDRIIALENQFSTIDGRIDEKIADANHLKYKIETSLANIDTTKANNTIFLVPSSDPAVNDAYEEFMYVDGSFERLGALNNVNLTGYATENYVNNAITNLQSNISADYVLKSTYNSEVGDLSAYRTIAEKPTGTVGEGLKDLYERLQWVDMTEE